MKWRLASSFPKSLDTIYGAGAFFCERVGKLTEGKFEITPYAAGQITKPLEVLDEVQKGTVECGHTASYYYVGKNKAFAFGSVTNLAARLCSEAKGGQIITNQKTLARIEESTQVEPLGDLTLKGISHPVPAFNVTGRVAQS